MIKIIKNVLAIYFAWKGLESGVSTRSRVFYILVSLFLGKDFLEDVKIDKKAKKLVSDISKYIKGV